jgi:hypothetical protein
MATYDPNFNRVHVRVARPDQVGRVYEVLKDRLIRPNLDAPDKQGRISIPYWDEDANDAAKGVRNVIARDFPGSEDWISVEARKGWNQGD